MTTLNIGETAISVFINKMTTGATFVERALHGNQQKIDEEDINSVLKHIRSFPAVESHYTRAKSQRLYLPSNLNIAKMYDLFVEKYPATSVRKYKYRQLFCNNFNYGFHRPKRTCA